MTDDNLLLAVLDALSGRAPDAATGLDPRGVAELRRTAAAWVAGSAVLGLGLAARESGGARLGERAIKVYVEAKRPRAALEAPVPTRLRVPGVGCEVPLDVTAIGPLAPQAAPTRPGTGVYHQADNVGTFGAVLRERAGARRFLLSNAHVLAPGPQARVGDPIFGSGDDAEIARLSAWSRVSAGGPVRVDAAIAEVDPERVSAAIEGLGLPTGTSNLIFEGMPVKLRGHGSGAVRTSVVLDANFRVPGDLAAGSEVTTPFDLSFVDQVMCEVFTEPGDSGSAVLNADGRLVGLHFWGSNRRSVFNRIVDVLAEFRGQGLDVEPVTTRNETTPVAPPPAPPGAPDANEEPEPAPAETPAAAVRPPVVEDRANAIGILARTLWGEARGESREGREAVAEVVVTRANRRPIHWWGMSVEQVCQKPSQFSCWLPGDPNRAKLLAVTDRDAVFRECLVIAERAVRGEVGTLAKGATHYYRAGTPTPAWARGKRPCVTIGNHKFYNTIE